MSVVELDGITVARGGATLIEDVSWRIDKREHAALIGANGSGKTTLLKVLTGYEWPTLGRVRVLDGAFGDCDLRDLRRHIGWVSSAMERRFLPGDTAAEVVGSGFDAALALYRPLLPAEKKRAKDLLAHLGVEGLASRAFGLLSHGEQKRVLIARALALDPALLVLDEPCSGLDPVSRVDFIDDLGALATRESGPTVLLVTHHLEEIRPWVQQALTLRNGRMVKQGPCDSVLIDEVLSRVFGRACRVGRNGAGYELTVESIPDGYSEYGR